MRIGPLTVISALVMSLVGLAPNPSSDSGWGGGEAHAKKGKKGKKGRRSYFKGHGVSRDELRVDPVPRPSGDLWIYAVNFRQEVRVNIYGANTASGEYDDEVLAQLDEVFRCKRTGEKRAVDPRLYERLSAIQDHFAGKRVELVSGFRFQEDEGSRHFHASAMDFRIPGVSNRELYDYAQSLDQGGMGIGIYPRSEFVHVDYRAPGEPSYRWTDRSPPGSEGKSKRPSRRWKRPNT